MSNSSNATKETFISPFNRPWLQDSAFAASTGGLRGAIGGGITGAVETIITYPVEYVKTQLQLDEKGARKKYKGMTNCMVVTVKERGFFGLYRGLSILVIGSIPKAALRFGSYEFYRGLVEGEGPLISLMCGMGAGINEAIFAVTPMETIKVKFIHDQRSANPRYRGLIHGVGLIIKEQGIFGIYRGAFATILRQATNQATRFFVVDSLKAYYKKQNSNKDIPKAMIGLFGGTAGICSVLVNNPIDVVKTRMQGLEAKRYKSSVDCFIQVGRNEGPFGYYKGVVPRLGRVCLAVGLQFTIYETIKDIFKRIWPE